MIIGKAKVLLRWVTFPFRITFLAQSTSYVCGPTCHTWITQLTIQIHSPLHVHAAILSPSTSLPYTLFPRHATRTWPHSITFPKTDAAAAAAKVDTTPNASDAGSKLLYVQVVQTSGYNTRAAPKATTGKTAVVRVSAPNGEKAVLGEGDGVFVRGGVAGEGVKVENVGGEKAEVLVFEMDA
jgi:hypothetical protein